MIQGYKHLQPHQLEVPPATLQASEPGLPSTSGASRTPENTSRKIVSAIVQAAVPPTIVQTNLASVSSASMSQASTTVVPITLSCKPMWLVCNLPWAYSVNISSWTAPGTLDDLHTLQESGW